MYVVLRGGCCCLRNRCYRANGNRSILANTLTLVRKMEREGLTSKQVEVIAYAINDYFQVIAVMPHWFWGGSKHKYYYYFHFFIFIYSLIYQVCLLCAYGLSLPMLRNLFIGYFWCLILNASSPIPLICLVVWTHASFRIISDIKMR